MEAGNNGAITGFRENVVQLTNELPEQFAHSQGLEDEPWKNLKGLGFNYNGIPVLGTHSENLL